jgi:hypothetical protein
MQNRPLRTGGGAALFNFHNRYSCQSHFPSRLISRFLPKAARLGCHCHLIMMLEYNSWKVLYCNLSGLEGVFAKLFQKTFIKGGG